MYIDSFVQILVATLSTGGRRRLQLIQPAMIRYDTYHRAYPSWISNASSS